MAEKKSYWELLRSPEWQKKRLQIMERDEFTCQKCDAREKTLNVHHKIYHKGRKPWQYEDRELVTLCEDCHGTETKQRQCLNEALSLLPPLDVEYVLGYATAQVLLFVGEHTPAASGGPIRLDGPAVISGFADGMGIDALDPEYDRLYEGVTAAEAIALHRSVRERRRNLAGVKVGLGATSEPKGSVD